MEAPRDGGKRGIEIMVEEWGYVDGRPGGDREDDDL
jgi:hypothetical protein